VGAISKFLKSSSKSLIKIVLIIITFFLLKDVCDPSDGTCVSEVSIVVHASLLQVQYCPGIWLALSEFHDSCLVDNIITIYSLLHIHSSNKNHQKLLLHQQKSLEFCF